MKIVMKLGGSVMTRKDLKGFPMNIGEIESRADEFIRTDVIERIGSEIAEAMESGGIELILINGAGPFGHFLVSKKQPLEIVHESVDILNERVVEYLDSGLGIKSVPPNETCSWDGKEFAIGKMWDAARKILKSGWIPSTYGDILKGYKIISGDDLAVMLADMWKADKIISVIDKDGVFDKNPDMHKDARLIKVVKSKEGIVFNGTAIDVTGGLENKIKKFLAAGVKSQIINGMVPGNVKKALLGDESIGTMITPSK
jgi:isopentenyl phosphate kinase